MPKDLIKLNDNSNSMVRTKKNFMAFLKVYNGCLHKGKDKEFCFYLANMFHMLRGSFGPLLSKYAKYNVV